MVNFASIKNFVPLPDADNANYLKLDMAELLIHLIVIFVIMMVTILLDKSRLCNR